MLALEAVALKLTPQFAYSIGITRQPVVTWVLIQLLAGACYVYGCCQLHRLRSGIPILALIMLTGLIMRGLMWFSTPALETDFYRYLWDGAMLANGHNPYALSPAEIQTAGGGVPDAVARLAVESQPVLDRVNHPQLTTVYPLAAASVFALAYLIEPWSVDALRGVYLVLDLAAAGLLAMLLRRRAGSLLLLFVFWCNPLMVRWTYNALHMDIIVVLLMALLAWGIARRRTFVCAMALGAAIGAKIWPVLLGVHLWIRQRMRWSAAAGMLLGLALLGPMLLAASHTDSGLVAYAESWQVNDPLFRLVSLAAQAALGTDSIAPSVARLAGALLFALCLVHFYGSGRRTTHHVDMLIMTLGAFLVLLPAPYPWYFLWLLPWLVLRPVTAWIALTATLPLYELRFFFGPRDMTAWFDYVVVPVEFSPLVLLSCRRWFHLMATKDEHVS